MLGPYYPIALTLHTSSPTCPNSPPHLIVPSF
jgi:hypothetical protein